MLTHSDNKNETKIVKCAAMSIDKIFKRSIKIRQSQLACSCRKARRKSNFMRRSCSACISAPLGLPEELRDESSDSGVPWEAVGAGGMMSQQRKRQIAVVQNLFPSLINTAKSQAHDIILKLSFPRALLLTRLPLGCSQK